MCLFRRALWTIWQVLLVSALAVVVVTGIPVAERGPETGTVEAPQLVNTTLMAPPTLVRRAVHPSRKSFDFTDFFTRVFKNNWRYTDTNRQPLSKPSADRRLSQYWSDSCDLDLSVVKPLSPLPEFCDFGLKGAKDSFENGPALSAGMVMTKVDYTKLVPMTYLLDLELHRLVEKSGDAIRQSIGFEEIVGVRVLEEAEWVTNLNVFKPTGGKNDNNMPKEYYRLFVVLFSRQGQPSNLRIVAKDDAEFATWVCALQTIINSRKPVDHQSMLNLYNYVNLERFVKDSIEDQKVGLSTGDMDQLMQSHFIAPPPLRPSSRSSSFSSSSTASTVSSSINYDYFDRQDLALLFKQLVLSSSPSVSLENEYRTSNNQENPLDPKPMILDKEAFIRFACETQQMPEDRACEQFDQHKDNPGGLSLAAFVGFMSGPETVLGYDTGNYPEAEMDEAFSKYYIATSHNTYLLKDQMIGPSSVDTYILALLAGCRSVEIDIWDGPGGEPIVTHGTPSASSRVTLRYVLRAIAKYAFANNPYPVILSIETGCNENQQKVAADIFKEELGDLLVTDYLPGCETKVPTIGKLLNRILIKNKHPQAGRKNSKASLKSPLVRRNEELAEDGPHPYDPRPRESDEQSESGSWSTVGSNSSNGSNPGSSDRAKPRIVPELDKLTVYFKGSRLPSLYPQPEFNEMYSLNEKAIAPFEGHWQDFVALTANTLIRVFPKASRISSDNYDPVKFWAYGCQMAALNYQTFGRPMQLNNAMFALNKRSGYVLKPPSRGGPSRLTSSKPLAYGYTITAWSGGYIPRSKAQYDQPAKLSVQLITDQAPYTMKGITSTELPHPASKDFWPVTSLRLPTAKGIPMFVEFVVSHGGKQMANAIVHYDALKPGYRHIYLDTSDEDAVFVPYLFVHIGHSGDLESNNQPTNGLPAMRLPLDLPFRDSDDETLISPSP
ncbi:hypothetical protein H4R35_004156 [Dimargaris xerosporica]|nr:hypothetical protein H4R35_004156 [Dimargaris xerosporica]